VSRAALPSNAHDGGLRRSALGTPRPETLSYGCGPRTSYRDRSCPVAGVVRPRLLRPSTRLPERRMPDEINSDCLSHEACCTLDEIKRLQTDRAHRDARRTFFVEGVRNVVQAIENGFPVEMLVCSEKLLIVPIARRLVRDRCRSGTPTVHVTPDAFRQISTTHHASGVGAIVSQRWSPLHGASPRAGLCWVVLEALRIVGYHWIRGGQMR
jgi:hypothetical protein